MLNGDGPLLPVPAHDERETALLTTSLRAGAEIDDDIAVVVATSGTTGVPKGAMLTASALTASAEATHRRLGGPGRWLLALPAYHIAGLQVMVRSVAAGTTPVAVAAGFDGTELSRAVAAMTSSSPERRYASLVAAQLARALGDDEATQALADLDAVLIGGGPMPAVVAKKAAAAGITAIRTYGMSETAGGCVYDGTPLDGVSLRIEPSSGAPPSGGVGRIVLGGGTLASGYRNPAASDPFGESGWFRTDDVGTVDDSGALTVLGRADDAISTGGLTVLPELVENALMTHPAVADCAVFGVADDRLGQRVVAAAVLTGDAPPPALAEIRAHLARSLPSTAAPRELHLLDELPRHGIGKVDRRALAERFSS